LRSVVAGAIYAIIFLFVSISSPHSTPWYLALLYPVIFPIGYFLFYLPVGLICGFIGSKFDFAFSWVFSLITIIFALTIIVADPVMFFIQKKNPQLVPVEKYGVFNFALIIFALNPLKPEYTSNVQ
jgi:hypothetical protein